MSITRNPDELVWVYSLVTDQVLLPLHQLYELQSDDRLGANESLTFRVKADDVKSQYLVPDQKIRWDDRLYRVTEMVDTREGNRVFIDVYCEALWYDLQKRIKVNVFTALAQTVEQGLDSILANTGWARGVTPVDPTPYSLEATDETVLALLRRWQQITGYEVQFDTATSTVNMFETVGTKLQIPFRYGRNLTSVKRDYEPPTATRLYAYGANGLTIAATNPTGNEFVEDYSWYTDVQGLSLIDAQNRFRKDQVWQDDAFLTGVNLYDAALQRMANLAQPVISYEVGVVDLSEQLGLDEGAYVVGDTVQVYDEELNIDIETRIVRVQRTPRNPENNQVELDYLRPGLTDDPGVGGRTIDYGQVATLVDFNENETVLSASNTRYAEIALTLSGTSTPIMGSTLVGTATGSGTLTVYATIDGTDIGQRISVDFLDGEQVEVSWPTFVADVSEGTFVIDWRAEVTSGSGTVTLPAEAGRSWIIVRGAVGIGFASSPNQFISESVAEIMLSTVSDAVTARVAEYEEVIVISEAASGIDYEAPSVLVQAPFTLDNGTFGQLDGVGRLAFPEPEERQ